MAVSVETVFYFIGKAKDLVCEIMDRLEQLKLSDTISKRVKENLEYIELTIKKIEPHVKKGTDTEEIKNMVTHLQNASESCTKSKKNIISEIISAPSTLLKIHTTEAEIKMANAKLLLFITSNNLTKFCDNAKLQNKKLDKIAAMQINNNIGISLIADKSVSRPSIPMGLTIQENQNKFLLSWKPSTGTVDGYEVCYDEHKNFILPVGKVTTIEIGSPLVLPGNIYTIKVRGINKGGEGEWSDAVVGQFRKPFPQRPEISNTFIRSTIAAVTVQIPGAICSTESAVTYVEVSYVSTAGTKWSNYEFKIEPGDDTYYFMVRDLLPDKIYNFRARTKNAEGWSEASELIEGTTLTLPPKPSKLDPPTIKPHPPNNVEFVAIVPENTCGKTSPIIEWKVTGYGADKEKVDKLYPVDEKILMNENCFEEKSFDIGTADLNPNQQYTLQLFARNENGWSAPSERFTICIAKPSTPIKVRVSTKRTHSLIKIRWNPPDSSLITHYEIVKRTKKSKNGEEKPNIINADKLSATFTKLKQNTHYCFKVRACNGSYASSWSKEVEANTRIHKAIKATLSPAVWVAGTVASPVIVSVTTGAVAGIIGKEESGNKVAVAAGTAGTVGGAVLGTVGAPLVGAGMAHAFVHGVDTLSDQSEDENAVIIEAK